MVCNFVLCSSGKEDAVTCARRRSVVQWIWTLRHQSLGNSMNRAEADAIVVVVVAVLLGRSNPGELALPPLHLSVDRSCTAEAGKLPSHQQKQENEGHARQRRAWRPHGDKARSRAR
ncbi:unnamed protein product [Musa acuminata subsp. burmannicoides]